MHNICVGSYEEVYSIVPLCNIFNVQVTKVKGEK